MDVLSLSSSHSISKPIPCLPLLSSKQQHRTSQVHFSISCRATNGNFYKVLSVSPGSATKDEIKKAYRLMALQYHPDVCHDPSMKEESTRMFVQLNAAYETLSNPMLREKYDSELGLRSNKMNVNVSDEIWRSRWQWQEEVVELKNRSRRRMGQKGGSRMRTQNMKDRN